MVQLEANWKLTMWKFALLAFAAVAMGQKATFENYKVFRVTPNTEAQINVLKDLEVVSDGFSFWSAPSLVNASADVMVAPHKVPEFLQFARSFNVQHEIFVENVQELIDNENPRTRVAEGAVSGRMDWTSYHTLEEIYAWMDQLAKSYPKNVQIVVGGKSYEGRQIKGVKLSYKSGNSAVFIDGNIHAREWITSATVTYLLNQLVTSKDPSVRKLAESHDWYIFPVLNPDGYVYTHTDNRLWRKTRSRTNSICYGADANRNFGYKWMEGGSSTWACSETYAGKSAFSEIEVQTLSQYMKSISKNLKFYLSFHSYSQLLMFPYGHTKQHLENYDQLYTIGTKTIQALKKRYGTSYVTGNIAETIYVASGSSVDWVKGVLKVPIAYTYELRDKGKYGFILPADQIIPNSEEILDSLLGMFAESARQGIN